MPYGQAYPGIGAADVAAFVGARRDAEERARQAQIDAIRWQGTQEYETLVRSGVPAGEALRRSAARMFFNDPGAISRALTTDVGTGQIFEQGGRQFIMNPGGKVTAVPQRWMGTTTVIGPDNQIYKIPLTPEELAVAPRQSVAPTPPQVVPLPAGQGSMIVQPSGAGTRVPPPPTEFVKIADPDNPGSFRTLTKAEYLVEQAQTRAKPLLDAFRANSAEIAAGEQKAVWDWIPGVETYAQKNARIKEQLKAYDLDENGNPLPGSKLAAAVDQASPATPVTPTTPAPAPTPTAPMVQPGLPGAPTVRRPTYREGALRPGTRFTPGTVYGLGLGNTNAPLNTTLRGTAPMMPNVSLATNEVLKVRRKADGSWEWAVFDKNTNQRLRSAQ